MNAAPFFALSKFWNPERILEFTKACYPKVRSTKGGEWSSKYERFIFQTKNGMNKAKANEINRFYPLNMKKAIFTNLFGKTEEFFTVLR